MTSSQLYGMNGSNGHGVLSGDQTKEERTKEEKKRALHLFCGFYRKRRSQANTLLRTEPR